MTVARGRPGARPLLAASRAPRGVSDEKLPSSPWPRPAGGKAASACCSPLGTPTPASTARSDALDSARPRMLGAPDPRAEAACRPCSLKTSQTHRGSACRSGWRPCNYFCGQHLPGSSHPETRTPYLVHENTSEMGRAMSTGWEQPASQEGAVPLEIPTRKAQAEDSELHAQNRSHHRARCRLQVRDEAPSPQQWPRRAVCTQPLGDPDTSHTGEPASTLAAQDLP